jgi:hypothetical protein
MAPDTEGLVPDPPVKLGKKRPKKDGKQRLGPETEPLGIEQTLDTPELLQRQLAEPPAQIVQPQQFSEPRLGKDRK